MSLKLKKGLTISIEESDEEDENEELQEEIIVFNEVQNLKLNSNSKKKKYKLH